MSHFDSEEHSHEHVHEHSHEHEHEHSHTHSHDGGSAPDVKSLLKYMIDHNDHHNEELADLLDSLPADAQKKMRLAIGTFEAANVQLQDVLDNLQ